MRTKRHFLVPMLVAALAATLPTLAMAEVEKAVIAILGGMQCSL
jgi:hypothetical protein